MDTITLQDNTEIPQLGLGTWELRGEQCTTSVAAGVRMGYRHVDTAFAYANHAEVAEGIAQGGVPREELYLTTKIPLGKQQRSQVIQLGQTLQSELRTDYVDLLLIHWPDKNVDFSETLGAMAELVKKGIVRSIGISNFNAKIMAEAVEASPVPVVTNQVEFHAHLYQRELLDAAAKRNVRLTAYSPLARGAVLSDERIGAVAAAHGVEPAQVALSWILSKGVICIPKASSSEHLRANLDAADLRLTPEEIQTIDAIDVKNRVVDGPWKHYPLE